MTNISLPASDVAQVAREFSDFDIASLPASRPDGFECTAWHNDVCPTWMEATGRDLKAGNLLITVDYADAERREFENTPRYGLSIYDAVDNWETVVEGDDWTEIETMVAFVRYVRDLGLAFHVDTRGHDYVGIGGSRWFNDAAAAEYDATIEAAHGCCDPYGIALRVWEILGLVEA